VLLKRSARANQSLRRTADLGRDRKQIGLVAFEEPKRLGKQRRFPGPRSKPIWGQSAKLKEPLRAPFVGEHCSKRGQRQRCGVIWR
jgi:hypothetical protein